jgi:hypothetical protein
MIEYHNPDAQVGIETMAYELSAVIKGSEAINIGFLANGFPDSENFLRELEIAMQDIAPGIGAFAYNKGNASIPAGEELLSEISGRCAAVVAAYGH